MSEILNRVKEGTRRERFGQEGEDDKSEKRIENGCDKRRRVEEKIEGEKRKRRDRREKKERKGKKKEGGIDDRSSE